MTTKDTHRRLAILSLCLALGGSGRVWAQLPAGSEFRINSSTATHQEFAEVAMDAHGGFVVAWWDGALDGSSGGIRQRRFSANGAPLAGGFPVNSYTTLDQTRPAIASGAQGNFVIVWTSYEQDGDGTGIFGQRYDAAGEKLGSEFRVNGYTTGHQFGSDVAADADGNFVVVWTSEGQSDIGDGIRARRYDAQGVALDPGFRVNDYTTGHQSSPAVASDPSGNFVVVWRSDGQDGSGLGIFGQLFDAAGNPRGSEFRVNGTTAGDQDRPDVAMDQSGNFAVVWDSEGQDGSEEGVRARVYDADGAPLGGGFAVNSYTTGAQAAARVAWDASESFTVVWSAVGPDGSSFGISAQRFDASGAPQGAELLINT